MLISGLNKTTLLDYPGRVAAMAECFSNKINMNKSMYFELGDLVTCVDNKWGIILNTQVKGIENGYSKKEASVVVTFGDDVPTLISLIKAQY